MPNNHTVKQTINRQSGSCYSVNEQQQQSWLCHQHPGKIGALKVSAHDGLRRQTPARGDL